MSNKFDPETAFYGAILLVVQTITDKIMGVYNKSISFLGNISNTYKVNLSGHQA